ncbi:hypothetical protein MKX47_11745 [Solibacillus sp. FSL R7-0668]|uniref:hypothetical protein n=1 Tax=Solibacillus sp. FSL R7-0668 TaxID=2921688 RepID=UPI0030FA75A4
MKNKTLLISVIIMFIVAVGVSGFAILKFKNNSKSHEIAYSNSLENDLSEYPTGVQLGYITPEFFDSFSETLNRYLNFEDEIKFINTAYTNKSDEQKIEEYIQLYRDEIVYLNGLSYTISTPAEREIENYYSSVLYHREQWCNYKIKYFTSKDKVFKELASDEFDSMQQDMLTVMDILKKYQIEHFME